MPDIIAPLKAEIRRLARLEILQQTKATFKATTLHRKEIAALKRMIQRQGKVLAKLESQPAPEPPPVVEVESDSTIPEGFRYSARSVRAQRKRLGLSAEQFGKLIGVSMQTVYSWEQGRARPRRSQIKLLADARTVKRRDAHRAVGLTG